LAQDRIDLGHLSQLLRLHLRMATDDDDLRVMMSVLDLPDKATAFVHGLGRHGAAGQHVEVGWRAPRNDPDGAVAAKTADEILGVAPIQATPEAMACDPQR
jgi:hypothetical protein